MSGMISLDRVLSRNDDMLANDVGTETVMMSISQSKYYGMNRTGSHIWKLLEKPMTVSELCKKLAETYNIPEDKCAEEIIPFIEDMNKENIIFIK